MSLTQLDFSFGLQDIVPSANNRGTAKAKAFATVVQKALSDLDKNKSFPIQQSLLLVVIQFFKDKALYKRFDVDNMGKVLLDALCKTLYDDDKQIMTLVVSKQCLKRVPDNFVYVGVKLVRPGDNIGLVAHAVQDARAIYAGGMKSNQSNGVTKA